MNFSRRRAAQEPVPHTGKAHIALACVELGDIRRIQKFTGQRMAAHHAHGGEAISQELMGRTWQEAAPLPVAHAPLATAYAPSAPVHHAAPAATPPGLIPQVTSAHPAGAFASLSVQRP